MIFKQNFKRLAGFTLVFAMAFSLISQAVGETPTAESESDEKSFIKWVDFNVTATAMKKAMDFDIESYNNPDTLRINWIELLAYLGKKYGGDFSKYKEQDMIELVEKLREGASILELVEGKGEKYYLYYLEAYSAVLSGFVGEFETEVDIGGEKVWKKRYGLKVFSPIAKGFHYNDYDDFGAGRNYGYKRVHLGHDLMASVGTPVVCVESGVVEVLGWNRYGGWRIGIRSFDGMRYYFYAHLRKDRPYAEGLGEGNIVMAGDVIGYVGRSGYSAKENVNGIEQSHLHYGMQLIFDESQKEGNNEIWIDLYEITKFLSSSRSETFRDDETKERYRVYGFREEVPENRFVPSEA